jgi:hypothetical protein
MTCRNICFCNGAEAHNEHTLLLNVADASLEEKIGPGDEFAQLAAGVPVTEPIHSRTLSRGGTEYGHLEEEDLAEIKELNKEKERITTEVAKVQERLVDAEALVARFKKELLEFEAEQIEVDAKLFAFEHKAHMLPKRPGPFEWVDSDWFGAVCNLIVMLNLTFMAYHTTIHDFSPTFSWCSDNVFMVWYLGELLFKFLHHRSYLFFGRLMAVWWNWLDLGIVMSGVADQWVMPLLAGGGGKKNSSLQALKFLRLFRLLRFLKIIKAFLIADLSWISDSKAFELFMSGVIGVNAITIGCELDMQWWRGWFWVDNVFLVIYVFDLALRLKRWGKIFFVHPTDVCWNWLDFVVVTAGMLDSWLMPTIEIIQTELGGVGTKLDTSKFGKVMSLMKLMRLLRVLRLVRVLRGVPPLYTMLIGVIEAFKSMQYVIVLALLTLYGGSIIFTNLVGQGLIYDSGEAPPEALAVFGTVSQSFFSLFELMNGDTSVIEPIKDLVVGRLVFAGFMVISNWAILAILTAVVSDQMISASNDYQDEEKRTNDDAAEKHNQTRLLEIFEDNDKDKNGLLSKDEWNKMLDDRATMLELSEGTHLSRADLTDLFDCLSVEGENTDGRVAYVDLVHSLKANSSLADKRAVLHVMLRLRIMQDQMTDMFTTNFAEVKDYVKRSKGIVNAKDESL